MSTNTKLVNGFYCRVKRKTIQQIVLFSSPVVKAESPHDSYKMLNDRDLTRYMSVAPSTGPGRQQIKQSSGEWISG